jgi:hypothetical protein
MHMQIMHEELGIRIRTERSNSVACDGALFACCRNAALVVLRGMRRKRLFMMLPSVSTRKRRRPADEEQPIRHERLIHSLTLIVTMRSLRFTDCWVFACT